MSPKMKTTIPSDVWETKRSQISNLYTEEEWPLKQVMKKIRTEDFNPTETQLRSRLKKWGVTKPSRQRRKRPATRPTDRAAVSISQAQELELRSQANDNYIPQFVGYPPSSGSSMHPGTWDSRVRWILVPSHDPAHQPKTVPCCDGRRKSASSNASRVEGTSSPPASYPDHHHHHHNNSFDCQYHTASPTKDVSPRVESCPVTVFTGINPNLTTSPGDITPTSDAASSGLPTDWQSPDSTHHAIRTPGSTLPSPAIQPTSPWNYSNPDMRQRCSPSIYPLDDATVEQQVNYVKEYLDNDDNLSYPSLLDLPLNDGEVLDSFSMRAWKRPSSSGDGTAQLPYQGDISPRDRQSIKAQTPASSGPCTTATTPSTLAVTSGYQKMESPSPIDLSAVGGVPGSLSLVSYQAYKTEAMNNEYLLPSILP